MSIFRSIFGKAAPQEPQEQDAPEAQEPQERRTRQRINARQGTRVLIIDDSPTIIAALRKTLRSTGYETLDALDAESGIELARQERPDLIFLDIVLPGMSGFAALRAMRRDPMTQHIPIIMISGNEQATEQFYANRIGADDFMKKPFSRAEVFAHIEPLLDANQIPRRKNMSANEMSAVAEAEESQTTIAKAAPRDFPAIGAGAAPITPSKPPLLTSDAQSALDARKELTAMGLQYFDQQQFIAAIQRGDRLAFELFVAGGGIDPHAEMDGKTPIQIAREYGRTQIFALLRQQLAAQSA